MKKKLKILILMACFMWSSCGFGCKDIVQAQQVENANNNTDKQAKIDAYYKGFVPYCLKRYKVDLNNISAEDDSKVQNLAEALRKFQDQVVNIPAHELDDYVHKLIVDGAGNFKCIDKDEFKKLASDENNMVMWQSVPCEIANELKQGKFKLDKNYYNNMRGYMNYFMQKLDRVYDKDCGAPNVHGGLNISTDLRAIWPDYRFGERLFLDEQATKNLEMKIYKPYEVLGFILNSKDVKCVKLEDLKRYVYILMYRYPEEFGFIDEYLDLFSTDHFKMRMDPNNEENKKHESCDGCWHGFDIGYNFDYVINVEQEIQKEMFNTSFAEIKEISNKEERNRKNKELEEKVETKEYIERLTKRFIDEGKREHLTNKTYYLLNNYALLAKLLGFDAIIDEGHLVKTKSENKNRHVSCKLVDVHNVKICLEEFKSKDECKSKFIEKLGG